MTYKYLKCLFKLRVNLMRDNAIEWSFYWIESLLISNKILLLNQFSTIIRKYEVIVSELPFFETV